MSRSQGGFTLVEMIVVVFLLAIAMLGILSVFDASARINKSEQDVAETQGSVRFGIAQMTRAIRMSGSGGLFVTQAVLNRPDPDLDGITVTGGGTYDNVASGTTVTPLTGDPIPVRPGTDMIEIRGVINSPLLGFDLTTGCEPCSPGSGCSECVGPAAMKVAEKTGTPHVNDSAEDAVVGNRPKRPQFSQVDAYTAGVSVENPMLVIVAFNDDIHTGCAVTRVVGTDPGPQTFSLYPQTPYNVGAITAPTSLVGSKTLGTVNFDSSIGKEFNSETPGEGAAEPQALKNIRHAGVLDDLVFFIDNRDPNHPALTQGTRRGDKFDVVTLADDIEDMQIAYGVDTNGDNAVGRLGTSPQGSDANVSTQADGDEWVPNVAGETPYATADFQSEQPPPAPFTHPGSHCPRLHGVIVSLVAKSHDPDPTYRSPSALGILTMNSPVTIASPYPDTAQYAEGPPRKYRRRIQTLKINLRNYAYEG